MARDATAYLVAAPTSDCTTHRVARTFERLAACSRWHDCTYSGSITGARAACGDGTRASWRLLHDEALWRMATWNAALATATRPWSAPSSRASWPTCHLRRAAGNTTEPWSRRTAPPAPVAWRQPVSARRTCGRLARLRGGRTVRAARSRARTGVGVTYEAMARGGEGDRPESASSAAAGRGADLRAVAAGQFSGVHDNDARRRDRRRARHCPNVFNPVARSTRAQPTATRRRGSRRRHPAATPGRLGVSNTATMPFAANQVRPTAPRLQGPSATLPHRPTPSSVCRRRGAPRRHQMASSRGLRAPCARGVTAAYADGITSDPSRTGLLGVTLNSDDNGMARDTSTSADACRVLHDTRSTTPQSPHRTADFSRRSADRGRRPPRTTVVLSRSTT